MFAATSYFLYISDIKKLGKEPTFADYCEKSTFGRKNAVITLNGIFGFFLLIFIQPISGRIEKFEEGVWVFDIGIFVIELNWIKFIAIYYLITCLLEWFINDPKIRRKYFNQGPVTNSESDLKRIYFENTLIAAAYIFLLILFA